MADTSTISLCILWEDELRAAADLLQKANDAPEDEMQQSAMQAAWAACSVALHGLTKEKTVVLLAAATVRVPRKKK